MENKARQQHLVTIADDVWKFLTHASAVKGVRQGWAIDEIVRATKEFAAFNKSLKDK